MTPDYAAMSDVELKAAEQEIARRYLNRIPWRIVFWGFANTACWLALWPLVFLDVIPLWLGFILATVNFMLFYLPSHEVQHSIVARPGEKLRWLNELVGHVSSMPMAIPFRVFRETHMQHHKYANDPELDPDYDTHADTPLGALWASVRARQPRPVAGRGHLYGLCLQRLERGDLILEATIYKLVFFAILAVLAWSGYALEAALLWWLPKHIGTTYLHFYLSWAPHNPQLGVGRYQDTRSFKSIFGNLGSMGMQYHIVHHLYPRIPLSLTPAAFRELKPLLQKRGCDLGAL